MSPEAPSFARAESSKPLDSSFEQRETGMTAVYRDYEGNILTRPLRLSQSTIPGRVRGTKCVEDLSQAIRAYAAQDPNTATFLMADQAFSLDSLLRALPRQLAASEWYA